MFIFVLIVVDTYLLVKFHGEYLENNGNINYIDQKTISNITLMICVESRKSQVQVNTCVCCESSRVGGSVLTNIFLVPSTSILEPNLKVFKLLSNVIEKKKCFVKRAPTSLVIDNISIRYRARWCVMDRRSKWEFQEVKVKPIKNVFF